MPKTSATERRLALRELLEREQVTYPASVWDPVSARLAQSLGFELGMFAGSIASHVVLGAPDIVLLTLSEFVEQAQRITRAFDQPLLVDADHGYGNALNVRRTVEELESAGIAGLTIEDTQLPAAYGVKGAQLISREEFGAKLRAAVATRSDKLTVVIGRTSAVASAGFDEALARVTIATEAGVDALFVLGLTSQDQVEALSAHTTLPLMLNAAPAANDVLAGLRVRVMLQGHLPYFVAMKALYEAYEHYRNGGAPAGLREHAASAEVQAIALAEGEYADLAREFLATDR